MSTTATTEPDLTSAQPISVREALLTLPKAPITVTVDKGALTQARLRSILSISAGMTLIAWAGYSTSGGENLFTAIGVPAGILLGSFIAGFIATFAFGTLKAIRRFSARWHGADVDAIESGHYLWRKKLTAEAAADINRVSSAGYAEKQSSMLKVLAGIGCVTAVLGSLGGIGEPNFGEYVVTVVALVVALFVGMGGFFWLVFWISRPIQFLGNGLDQIVFTEDGLLVEPIYWPWDTRGFRLEEISLAEGEQSRLDLLFANHYKGQMQRHELSIPLDPSDVADVRVLVQLLGNYRARSALKDEVKGRLNPIKSASAF